MTRILLLLFVTLVVFGQLTAQDRSVTGRVTSSTDGEPLPGVNVVVKGTNTGTVTDAQGSYSLQVPTQFNTLVFSFIGLASQEVEIGNRTVVDVQMNEDITQLSEVVVTGYGQQLKTDLTGNIAKISGEDIQNLPTPNFEETIQGRATGVLVESSNGKLGQGIKVRVRGSSSITADNQPLYVVDGVPITTQNIGELTEAAVNPLSDLNPNDIASIEILKDASAAAIYGSRASNGVVLITTKTGTTGKTKFNINYQTGWSNPTNKRDWLNAEQYVDYILEAAENSDELDGVPITDPDSWYQFALGRLDRYSGGTDWQNAEVDTDWEDQIYNEAARNTRFDVSMSGGSDDTRFYISGSYLDQEGILIGNEMQRYSGRINVDHDVNDRLTVGINMNLVRTDNDRVADDNAFSTPVQLIALAPITPIRDENGNLNDRPVTTYYNGLIDLEGVTRSDITYRNFTNAFAQYELIEGLMLRGEFGVDLLTQNQERFWADYTDGGQGTGGYGISRWARVVNATSKAYLTYDKTFDVHSLNFTGGFEYQKSETRNTQIEGQEYPVNDLKTIASAAEIADGTGNLTEFSFVSYFGRVNYKFNNKYLFSASVRVDGSSRFGANNKYGTFPAASVGWILSEEDFLSGNSTLSFLKLRASYGQTGNAQIGNFAALGTYEAEGYAGSPGLQPVRIANPDLTWEKATQYDIGIDFGILDDRITGEIDYYRKESTDLLLDRNIPGHTAFRFITQNIGALENRGIELALNGTILDGPVTWDASFNIAFNTNEVTDLGENDIIDDGGSRIMNVVKVGEPIGVFWGKEYAGVDPSNGDALWFVNDEADPRATTNDFNTAQNVALGSPNPDYFGGFTNRVTWNGFDFNMTWQFVQGNEIHNVGGVFQLGADWFDNQSIEIDRRWRNPGDITDVPKAYLAYGNGGQGRSSRFLYDGSYIRLKTLSLGYSLPASLLSNAGFSSARVYVSGINLVTITDYPGWDPEVSADYLTVNADGSANNIFQGNDFYSAPQAKTFTVGVQIGF